MFYFLFLTLVSFCLFFHSQPAAANPGLCPGAPGSAAAENPGAYPGTGCSRGTVAATASARSSLPLCALFLNSAGHFAYLYTY